MLLHSPHCSEPRDWRRSHDVLRSAMHAIIRLRLQHIITAVSGPPTVDLCNTCNTCNLYYRVNYVTDGEIPFCNAPRRLKSSQRRQQRIEYAHAKHATPSWHMARGLRLIFISCVTCERFSDNSKSSSNRTCCEVRKMCTMNIHRQINMM